MISIDLDTIPIDEIPTKINNEIISQPIDDLVILLAPETPAEEVKHVIEEFSPKSENLTVLVGEKVIDEKTPVEEITDEMIQALPIIPGVLQKVIDEEPDSIIPVIKKYFNYSSIYSKSFLNKFYKVKNQIFSDCYRR